MGLLIKTQKAKEKFSDNHGDNILKHFRLVPSLLHKMKILSILANNCWKIEIDFLMQYTISQEN